MDSSDEQAKKDSEVAPEQPQASRAKPKLIADASQAKPVAPAQPARVEDDAASNDFRSKLPLPFIFGALVVLALGFGGGWLGSAAHSGDTPNSVSKQRVVLESQGDVIANIAKQVGPSVVSVNVTSQTSGSSNPYANLFGYGGSRTQQSAGTGVILTKDGLIMTNRHVVPAGTSEVSVTLNDGTEFDNVKVVGRTSDRDTLDVAFLQIQDTKGKALTAARLGDSSKVRVGDSVVAIGNALGQFQNTVTSGIISAYGRSLQASASDGSSSESLDNLFQTDAAINEGNSGGPLVNLDGEVIGMNTAIAAESQGIGFAIPINDVKGLIESVQSSGKLQRPYIGVVYVPVTNDVKEQYNLNVSQGAYIPTAEQAGESTVISEGPASKAGVQEGDVITKVNGKEVNETTSLTSLLGQHKVGDKVTLTIVRDGKTITKDVTLGAAPTN